MLSPYRNAYEPMNGMRGHGFFVRIDMNSFNLKGISYLDMTVTLRNSQVRIGWSEDGVGWVRMI